MANRFSGAADELLPAMGSTVLVLEDDRDFCFLLTHTLNENGYTATGVSSGPEAVALATREAFDLIVSDVRMEGMDGLEVLLALRKARPHMRAIVITGYASEEAPSRALQAEADDYLYKPFGFQDFLGAVKRVLDRRQEREGYRGLLASFLRRFQVEPSQDWEALRDLAYQTYYVGVRSRKLNEHEALAVWDELERISMLSEDLANEYRCVIERVAALARTQLYAARPRKPGQVEPAVFRRLYDQILQGRISPEQLKLAPYVRGTREDLAGTLWG